MMCDSFLRSDWMEDKRVPLTETRNILDSARLNKIKLNYLLQDFMHWEFHGSGYNVRCVLKADDHQPRFCLPRRMSSQCKASSFCHRHGQQHHLKRCLRQQTLQKVEERMPSKTARERTRGLCQVSWSFWSFAIHSPSSGSGSFLPHPGTSWRGWKLGRAEAARWGRPWAPAWPCCSLPEWPWVSYATSLILSLFVCAQS